MSISIAFIFAIGSASVRADDSVHSRLGTRLLLVGGGNRPPEAMLKYAEWAGGAEAQVLIIGWSSAQPEKYFGTISADLRAAGIENIEGTLAKPTEAQVDAVLEQIRKATAIFFMGGSQMGHLSVMNDHPRIRAALLEKFAAGTPFAGTSAGTAIMSEKTLLGVGSEIVRGLGLLPPGMIVDQHFLKRRRLGRLARAMKRFGIHFGIGIDEDSAIAVTDGTLATVYGPTSTSFYEIGKEADVLGVNASAGTEFNLKHWLLQSSACRFLLGKSAGSP